MGDEEAYNRHCVMQAKAKAMLIQGAKANAALAKAMLDRCMAYFESAGPHWLASARKARTAECLAACAIALDGVAAGVATAEALLLNAMRTAQRELGPTHRVTARITWWVGFHLLKAGRVEKARSLFLRAERLRGEQWGPKHLEEITAQVRLQNFKLAPTAYRQTTYNCMTTSFKHRQLHGCLTGNTPRFSCHSKAYKQAIYTKDQVCGTPG